MRFQIENINDKINISYCNFIVLEEKTKRCSIIRYITLSFIILKLKDNFIF